MILFAASNMSDKVILTSDNSRGESIEAILNDMRKGIPDEKAGFVF